MGFIDSLVDGLTGGGLSSFFSMFDAGLDSLGLSQHGRDQYFNREMQREFLESQQNFQREMTGVGQDFTREMYNQQWKDMLNKYPLLAQRLNDQQFNLWRQQFNMQNEWNESMYLKYQSPQAVVSQNAVAGLNPAGLNGINNGVSSNTMGASSAAAPPHINPVPFGANASPSGLPQVLSSKGHDISEVGQFLKDYSEMQLNQKKIGRFDEQMDAQIKESLAKAGLDESKSAYQKLITVVDGFFLPHKKASEVKLNLALAAKYASEENEAESQSKLNEALEQLNKTKNEEAKARLPFVEMEMRAEIDDIKASAAEKRAQAEKANQEAKTEKYNTQIKSIQADMDAKSKVSKLATLLNNLRRDRVLNTTLMKEATLKFKRINDIKSRKDNSWLFNEVDGFMSWLTGHIGVAINGNVSSVTKE